MKTKICAMQLRRAYIGIYNIRIKVRSQDKSLNFHLKKWDKEKQIRRRSNHKRGDNEYQSGYQWNRKQKEQKKTEETSLFLWED